MRALFEPDAKVVAKLPGLVSHWDLEREPMLLGASPDFAERAGGGITRMMLAQLSPLLDPGRFLHVVIDTRVHMLMAGMYPAIPGWHCDHVPRATKYAQPDPQQMTPAYQNFAVTLSNSEIGVSHTEYVHETLDLEYDETAVWASINDELEQSSFPSTWFVQDGDIVRFSQSTLHRATAAHASGWRFFMRLSYVATPPVNRIRNQTQVYTTLGKGW